jgi:hypothetical protein
MMWIATKTLNQSYLRLQCFTLRLMKAAVVEMHLQDKVKRASFRNQNSGGGGEGSELKCK